MGYQESWVYIQPQIQFDKMVLACEKQRESGVYHQLGTAPYSVVTLKKPFGEIPPGSKILWICGERCFQQPELICGKKFIKKAGRIGRVTVLPIERVLESAADPRVAGIEFDRERPSENAHMRRQGVWDYARKLHCREYDR